MFGERGGGGPAITCGILRHGLAPVTCASSKHEFLLALSWRVGHFCPSCHQAAGAQAQAAPAGEAHEQGTVAPAGLPCPPGCDWWLLTHQKALKRAKKH